MKHNVVRDMGESAQIIEKLRMELLLEEPEAGGQVLGPVSEQHYLLALTALEQAQRFMKIAHYNAMRKD